MLNRKNEYFRKRKERTMKTKLRLLTRCKTNAGLRRTKTASCFFQISGGWTTKEHEIRTGLTAQRCQQG